VIQSSPGTWISVFTTAACAWCSSVIDNEMHAWVLMYNHLHLLTTLTPISRHMKNRSFFVRVSSMSGGTCTDYQKILDD
jgi:REP element-mobilizing transposase RayT